MARRASVIEPVHIIDPDSARRARISREMAARNLHAEIYEDVDEFRKADPRSGVVLAFDELSRSGIGKIADAAAGILPLVVYANQPSPEQIVEAMLAGALDYLEWPFNPLLLDSAFRRLVVEGEQRMRRARLRSEAEARVALLSRRERQVLQQLLLGRSSKQIAQALGLSPRTVELHRGNMMKKLDATSPADAVRIALSAELDTCSSLKAPRVLSARSDTAPMRRPRP